MTAAAADLGVLGELAGALGLVDGDGSFRDDWLSDPGRYLSAILADPDQRQSLVQFVDDVLGGATQTTDAEGLVWLPIVEEQTPALTVYVVLDERPADYVGVGIGARFATAGPASTTTVHVPLFRAAKKGRSGPPLSPLLLGSPEAVVSLSTDITVDPAAPVLGQAHLAGVGLQVKVATAAGGAPPTLALTLRGLQMPGAAGPRDLTVSAGDAGGLEDTVLDLVLGLVRAQAAALPPGPLTALAGALGLREGSGVPPLPFHDLPTAGIHALATWLESVVLDASSRSAWLAQLAELVGGAVVADRVTLTVGVAQVTLGVQAVPGADGHTRLTPTIGVEVRAGADAVVRADADVCTIDLGGGAAVALPRLALQLVLGLRPGGGSVLLDEPGPPHVRVETLRAGFGLDATRRPTLVVAADRVTIGTHTHETLDLSSPDAVADVGGVLLGDVADEVLARLGAAGDAVRALLGLSAPAGHPEVPTLDIGRFLQDPIGAVAEHWQIVVRDHPAAIPTLIEVLHELVADDGAAGATVDGTGTRDDPWSIRVAGPVALAAWVDGQRLTFGPSASLVVDTLGQRCTRVETRLRVSAVELDLERRQATFLPGIDAGVSLRARGRRQAVLPAGAFTLTADEVGFAARWTPTGGLGAEFTAPNLAVDFGSGPLPVPIPVIDENGHVTLAAEGWDELEHVLAALAAAAGPTWLPELVGALGWTPRLRPPPTAAHLRLADLVVDPVAAFEAWLGRVVLGDSELLVKGLSMLARLTAGTRAGVAGALPGSGRPTDPWLVPLARAAAAPRLAVWVDPDGTAAGRATTPTLLQSWRPGFPGLDSTTLAQSLAAEAIVADDVRDLLAGRPDVAAGFEALVSRWAGTDGRVVPPEADPDGVTVVRIVDVAARDLPALVDVEELLDRTPATVVFVAVAAPDTLPWPDVPAERIVDLTAAGLAPAGFTPPTPATGEWYVALGGRQAARLASGDADGVQGQAERLGRVLDAFSALPDGLVVVAEAAAGHAARRAAESATAITDLVLLGTPCGAVSFAVLDTQPGADALRLLGRLLPAVSDEQSDDPDLALGRGLVEGLLALLPLDDPARELQLPTPPPPAPRAGLAVHAVFGVASEEGVRRALTAVVAAGLASRSRTRASIPAGDPSALRIALRVPLPTGTPTAGDVTVDGHVQADVVGLAVGGGGAITLQTDRALSVHLGLGRKDAWLAGGPDPGRAPGTRPEHELRRITLDVTLPSGAGASAAHAQLTLRRGAHLRDRARALGRPAERRARSAGRRRGDAGAAGGARAALGGGRRARRRHRPGRGHRGLAARDRRARADRRQRPRRDRPPAARSSRTPSRDRRRGDEPPRARHRAPRGRSRGGR